MTGSAYRVHRDGEIIYVLPAVDAVPGRRVVYRQDPETFDTQRDTVSAQEARTLVESGREVSLAETPAWCDPAAPRTPARPQST
jgi:hypothetical protein